MQNSIFDIYNEEDHANYLKWFDCNNVKWFNIITFVFNLNEPF